MLRVGAINLSQLYIVDLELWHLGSKHNRSSIDEVRQVVEKNATPQERVRDEFMGNTLCLMKVSVFGEKLNQLLNLDAVAEIEFPPAVHFDEAMAHRATRLNFPTPPRPPRMAQESALSTVALCPNIRY